jgi:hypothetical protein
MRGHEHGGIARFRVSEFAALARHGTRRIFFFAVWFESQIGGANSRFNVWDSKESHFVSARLQFAGECRHKHARSLFIPSPGRMRLLNKFRFDNTTARKIFPTFSGTKDTFSRAFRNKPARRVFCLLARAISRGTEINALGEIA